MVLCPAPSLCQGVSIIEGGNTLSWGTVLALGPHQVQGELWELKGRRGPRSWALPGPQAWSTQGSGPSFLPSFSVSLLRAQTRCPRPPPQHLMAAAFPRCVLGTASLPSCGNQMDSNERHLTSVRVPEVYCHGYVLSGVSPFPPNRKALWKT